MTPMCSWGWDHFSRGSNPCYRWWNGGQVLGRSLWKGWQQPGPFRHPVFFTTGCPMGLFLVSFDGRRSHWVGHQAGKGGSGSLKYPMPFCTRCCSCAKREAWSWRSTGRVWGPPAWASRSWSSYGSCESVVLSSSTVSTTEDGARGPSQRRGPAYSKGPTSWPHSPPLVKSVPTMSGLAHLRNQEPESADALRPTAEGGHKNVKAPETLQLPLLRAWDLALPSFKGL